MVALQAEHPVQVRHAPDPPVEYFPVPQVTQVFPLLPVPATQVRQYPLDELHVAQVAEQLVQLPKPEEYVLVGHATQVVPDGIYPLLQSLQFPLLGSQETEQLVQFEHDVGKPVTLLNVLVGQLKQNEPS